MKRKKNYITNILKIAAWLSWFSILNPMMEFTKPYLPDLTEEQSKEATKEEERTQIIKQRRLKKCYDLMMILDPNYESKDSRLNSSYCAHNLRSALSEQKFPILVSSNIVENFCLWKQGFGQSPFATEVLYRFYPTDNDWYVYSHQKAPLVLLIPKNYISYFSSSANTNITEQIKECGFDVSQLHKFDNLLPQSILAYIKQQGLSQSDKPKQYPLLANDIVSLFIHPKTVNSPTWNVYLGGHGSSWNGEAQIAGLLESQFFRLMNSFEMIKTSFVHYCSCFSGGQNLVKVKQELSRLKVNFMVSTQGINESQTQAAPIGGAPFRTSLFSSFFSKLDTLFGNPKSFTARTKRENWENDPIASIVSEVINKNLLDESQPWVYIPAMGVFNALNVDKAVKILTQSLTKAYEFEGATIDFTGPDIETIIIYPKYIGIPLKIKAHVAVVSPTGLMVENQPIVWKQGPDEEGEPTFILEESENRIIHVLEKVIYDDALSSVISNFISFNSNFYPITFVIKKLECFDYSNSGLGAGNGKRIIIENMIITIAYDPAIGTHITAVFIHNNDTYCFSQLIIRLRENSKKLFEQFRHLSASQLTPNEQNEFLKKNSLAKKWGLNEGDVTNKTLETLVKMIESTIDKTSAVQEPGALKRSLLLKQKSILEKEAHELALPTMQKYQSKQQENKLNPVNYLQRGMAKAKMLEAEIKKVPFNTPRTNDQQPDVQQIYRQDIANIQQTLAAQHAEALAKQQAELPLQSWSTFLASKINQYFKAVPQQFSNVYNEIKNKYDSAKRYLRKLYYQRYNKQR